MWLLLLNIVSVRFAHTVVGSSNSFFFIAIEYSIVWKYHSSSNHPSLDRYLGSSLGQLQIKLHEYSRTCSVLHVKSSITLGNARLWFEEIYLVFVHASWLTAPKALGIYWVIVLLSSAPEMASETQKRNGCFVVHNEPLSITPDFGKALKDGAGCQENQTHDWRVETFSLTPWPLGSKEGLEVESITNSQWLDHAHVMKISSNQDGGVQTAFRLGN